jgi:hypothetical protein
MAGLVASREVLDVATSESNEHVAEAVPLRTSDPPLCVSAVLRRPLFTATSLTVATVHDDGDILDVAHRRHEVTVGSRVVRGHDEEPSGRRKGSRGKHLEDLLLMPIADAMGLTGVFERLTNAEEP